MLVENCSQEHTRTDSSTRDVKLNQEESMLEIGLLSTFNAIIQQASAEIYDASAR